MKSLSTVAGSTFATLNCHVAVIDSNDVVDEALARKKEK